MNDPIRPHATSKTTWFWRWFWRCVLNVPFSLVLAVLCIPFMRRPAPQDEMAFQLLLVVGIYCAILIALVLSDRSERDQLG